MTTETWQPAPQQTPAIAATTLINWCNNASRAAELIRSAEYSPLSYCVKKEQSYWFNCAETLNNDQLWQLMQFFALAEEADSNWAAGDQSPVIHLNKLLKSRGEKLEKTQLQWFRTNSSNRFLPNGPINL